MYFFLNFQTLYIRKVQRTKQCSHHSELTAVNILYLLLGNRIIKWCRLIFNIGQCLQFYPLLSPKSTTLMSWFCFMILSLMLKLKLQYFGPLMRRTDSLEKTPMLGKIEDRRRRERQRMKWLDGITYSMVMSLGKLWVRLEGFDLAMEGFVT